MIKAAWVGASLGGGLLAALLGCNPLLQRAREVETGFIGMETRALRRCLGVAPFFELHEDGTELWAYSSGLSEPDAADIEISRPTGNGTRHQRPRVEGGSPIERSSILTAQDAVESQVPPGSCVYLFTVRDEAIQGYRARGRSQQGMRADESCTVALERCVPAGAAAPASAG